MRWTPPPQIKEASPSLLVLLWSSRSPFGQTKGHSRAIQKLQTPKQNCLGCLAEHVEEHKAATLESGLVCSPTTADDDFLEQWRVHLREFLNPIAIDPTQYRRTLFT